MYTLIRWFPTTVSPYRNITSSAKSHLTYFSPVSHFYTPRKCLTFSGGIVMKHWATLKLSVPLRTKWLRVRTTLLSLKLLVWRLLRAKSSLKFRQTIKCGFTLNLVRDMIITCNPIICNAIQLNCFCMIETLTYYGFNYKKFKLKHYFLMCTNANLKISLYVCV